MNRSFSFGMLKPDCLLRQLEKEAFRRIAIRGVRILLKKQLRLNQVDVDVLYPHLRGRSFYEDMSYFLTSSDVAIFVAVGQEINTIKILNRIVGFTDPKYAKPGTLRELGYDIRHNIAHSASDTEAAVKSIRHFFSDQELEDCGIKCLLSK